MSTKINRLNHLLSETCPTFVVLTEHGLKQTDIENTKLEGYSLVSVFCRNEHRLGGVAIYCKDRLVNNTETIDITDLCEERLFEAALAHTSIKGKHLYILGVYRPPGGNVQASLDILSNILDHMQAHNKPLVITGDINIDMLKPNNHDNMLLQNELTTQNIRRLPLKSTRITPDTSTSIDCICTNILNYELSTTILHTGLSDHTAQICTLDFNENNTKSQILSRQVGKKNLDQLKSLLSNKNWDMVHNAEDAESAFDTFQGSLEIALDISCPRRRNKVKKKPNDYCDIESAELKTAFLGAMKTYQLTGKVQDKTRMVHLKKAYDNKLRTLQRTANAQKIVTSNNKSKAVWNIINSQRQAKQLSQNCPKLITDNTTIEHPLHVAEHLNTYFTQVAEKTLQQNNQQQEDYRLEEDHNLSNIPAIQPFKMTPTTCEEVNKVIFGLKKQLIQWNRRILRKNCKILCRRINTPHYSHNK
uniref:Endonuclease/exonuclease/phosphatase domain-containing protein n=1 Tax=Graphocephala atropunctata TaxID=36148 RepID=A0A1B6LJA2_9HEMI